MIELKQLIKMCKDVGFTGDDLSIACAIAIAESNLDENALGDLKIANIKWGPSYGLFQIRSLHNSDKYHYPDSLRKTDGSLFEPEINCKVAYAIYKQQKGFYPWSTFNNNKYKEYLDQVNKEINNV